MINLDYIKYIKILLILLYEKKILTKSEIINFLYLNNQQYKTLITTIKEINKPKILYKVNINKHEFIVFGELNFQIGILIGNKINKPLQNIQIQTEIL
jgi:hypothetical protein